MSHIPTPLHPVEVDGSPEARSRDLVELLLHRPTMDEIAQFIVLSGVPALNTRQVAIYAVDTASRLQLLGAFGPEQGRGDLDRLSALDTPLVSEVLRWRLPQTNLAIPDNDVEAQIPPEGPQLIWPLATPSRLRGVMQLRFDSGYIAPEAEAQLAALAPIMSLLLEWLSASEDTAAGAYARQWGLWAPSRNTDEPSPIAPPQHASADWRRGIDRGRPRALTARQQRVLELMAQGMTNGQIARALKFSESTVRQETMAIYRYLQVPGRVEAVDAAIERGLLPQPDPATVS
jgi:DNA-binding CsgD family transcriptional regulator